MALACCQGENSDNPSTRWCSFQTIVPFCVRFPPPNGHQQHCRRHTPRGLRRRPQALLPTVRQPVPATLPCLAMRTKTLCGVDQARPRARRTALRCAAHDIPGARRCRVPAALPGLAMRTTTLCGVDKAIVHAALPRCPPIRHAIPMSSDTAAAAPCPCPPHC